MMQSYERSRTYDEDDFERSSLLPFHHDDQRNFHPDAASFRSRRGGGRPRRHPPSSSGHHTNNDDEEAATENYEYVGGNGSGTTNRPGMTKINSIARLGRRLMPSPSSSYVDVDFDDGHPAENRDSELGGGMDHEVDDTNDDEYYYDDTTNDHNRNCSFGTNEDDGTWLNINDTPGIVMAIIVWVLIAYSGVTVSLLAEANRVSRVLAIFHCTMCALALACHAKTMLSDPGAVPNCALPLMHDAYVTGEVVGCEHRMCGPCGGYKPPGSHHCRICNRCVCRMDHHCPWMNNCVGAGNLKSFVLFLCYSWIGSALSLLIFGINYFFCADEKCEFDGVLANLVRIMTIICVASILFVSSMLANVTFGVMTGSGTIDRLKRSMVTNAAADEPDDPPMEFRDIFGIGTWRTWLIPIDPIFPDHDRVLGYSMPQRLLREGGSSLC